MGRRWPLMPRDGTKIRVHVYVAPSFWGGRARDEPCANVGYVPPAPNTPAVAAAYQQHSSSTSTQMGQGAYSDAIATTPVKERKPTCMHHADASHRLSSALPPIYTLSYLPLLSSPFAFSAYSLSHAGFLPPLLASPPPPASLLALVTLAASFFSTRSTPLGYSTAACVTKNICKTSLHQRPGLDTAWFTGHRKGNTLYIYMCKVYMYSVWGFWIAYRFCGWSTAVHLLLPPHQLRTQQRQRRRETARLLQRQPEKQERQTDSKRYGERGGRAVRGRLELPVYFIRFDQVVSRIWFNG